jgi:hypothetical protein
MGSVEQNVTSGWNERMRMIRLRKRKENLTFWGEFKIIPRWLRWTVVVLYLIAQAIALFVNLDPLHVVHPGEAIFPPELSQWPALASLALAGIVTGASLGFAALIFLAAYVYQDAKRRGMNAALWLLICIVFFPAYFVLGFIVYVLVREPLPYPCPRCGTTVGPRMNFCPNCRCNLRPACPACKREVLETDRYCAACGNALTPTAAEDTTSAPSAA